MQFSFTERTFTMDNQNNQNGYTNFNGYQAPQAPVQQPNAVPNPTPIQQNPYQPVNYQQTAYNPYQVPVQQPNKHKSLVLGILAIVIPIISCSYLSPIGLILGLIGVIRNKKSAVSWVGLVISILLVAFLCFVIYLAIDPDRYRAFLESSGVYSDEQIDATLRQIYGFIVSVF